MALRYMMVTIYVLVMAMACAYAERIHFGAFIDNNSPASNFQADAKRSVGIVLSYVDFDGSDLNVAHLEQVRAQGSIPMVTRQPSLGYQTLSQIISGKMDAYITKWAQQAGNWGKPWFLRYAHEMNGNWYDWSEQKQGNTGGEYVKSWIHIYNIFKQHAGNNVTFVWCPNIVTSPSTALTELYPGDDYVDWACIDGYSWGTTNQGSNQWQSFSTIFSETYDQILKITNKPIYIGETASSETGGSKADWIFDAIGVQIPSKFPKIRGINWFNINKELPWLIESSSSAQKAFAGAINDGNYTTNSYAKLVPGKIYPPTD